MCNDTNEITARQSYIAIELLLTVEPSSLTASDSDTLTYWMSLNKSKPRSYSYLNDSIEVLWRE
mgnify:CR=1 FL=1